MLYSRKYADQKFPLPPGVTGAASQEREERATIFAKMRIEWRLWRVTAC